MPQMSSIFWLGLFFFFFFWYFFSICVTYFLNFNCFIWFTSGFSIYFKVNNYFLTF